MSRSGSADPIMDSQDPVQVIPMEESGRSWAKKKSHLQPSDELGMTFSSLFSPSINVWVHVCLIYRILIVQWGFNILLRLPFL